MMERSSRAASPPPDSRTLIAWLTRAYPTLSPQLREAARHVLERPRDVAIKSMRGLAGDAGVPPSTMVRLAKAAGFRSYDALRKVFQDDVRTGVTDLVARAEWLQRLPEGGRDDEVVRGMASTILGNVEASFRGNATSVLAEAAELLRGARRTHVVGVGGMHAPAAYLHYVLRMALPDVRLAQPAMASVIDELSGIGSGDAVVVLSVAPYATETVRATRFAVEQGARLIALTDSRASPIAATASCLVLVPTATPQFFPSQVAMIGMLETLIALIVSHGDRSILERIDRIDRHRREEGVYWRGEGDPGRREP